MNIIWRKLDEHEQPQLGDWWAMPTCDLNGEFGYSEAHDKRLHKVVKKELIHQLNVANLTTEWRCWRPERLERSISGLLNTLSRL